MPRAAFLDGHGGILTDNRLPFRLRSFGSAARSALAGPSSCSTMRYSDPVKPSHVVCFASRVCGIITRSCAAASRSSRCRRRHRCGHRSRCHLPRRQQSARHGTSMRSLRWWPQSVLSPARQQPTPLKRLGMAAQTPHAQTTSPQDCPMVAKANSNQHFDPSPTKRA